MGPRKTCTLHLVERNIVDARWGLAADIDTERLKLVVGSTAVAEEQWPLRGDDSARPAHRDA
ncbi:MAG TPA: hypothetical protein VIP11_20360 [Gemmatimonadaceae bacterium]